jgi:hypothetical protein
MHFYGRVKRTLCGYLSRGGISLISFWCHFNFVWFLLIFFDFCWFCWFLLFFFNFKFVYSLNGAYMTYLKISSYFSYLKSLVTSSINLIMACKKAKIVLENFRLSIFLKIIYLNLRVDFFQEIYIIMGSQLNSLSIDTKKSYKKPSSCLIFQESKKFWFCLIPFDFFDVSKEIPPLGIYKKKVLYT